VWKSWGVLFARCSIQAVALSVEKSLTAAIEAAFGKSLACIHCTQNGLFVNYHVKILNRVNEKMRRVSVPVVLFLLLVCSSSWGQTVKRDGKEWLQPGDVVGVSWNDLNNACPARQCSGILNGVDIAGYTWASRADVTALLTSYGAPAVPSFARDNPWASSFFSDFPPFSGSTSFSDSKGLISDSAGATSGLVLQVRSFSGVATGVASDANLASYKKDSSAPAVGAYFYREATFESGGILSGLVSGDTVVLQNSGGDDLALSADGAFSFSSSQLDGTPYSVTVLTQPPAPRETCTVTNGSGTVAGVDVSNVSVTCVVDTFTVGGNVSGLAVGNTVTLQNNGSNDTSITVNGAFTFTAALADLSNYSVSVSTQPDSPDQTCTVNNASGNLAGANVQDVDVVCVLNTYQVGGSLTGLAAGDTLEIQNNGGDNLTLTADGSFVFPQPLDDGSTYLVSISVQPPSPSETCTLAGESGALSGQDVTSVYIACTINQFSVGGTLTGLIAGETLVVQNNGGDDLTLSADGAFTFNTPQDDATAYSVTVLSQPAGQTCSISNAAGNLTGANVTNSDIICLVNIAPTPPLARPVPAMPTLLLAAMALMLAAFSARRLRRQAGEQY